MLHDKPPRPRWNHPDVKAAAAVQFVDEIREWAEDAGIPVSDDREILAVITLAFQESPDHYAAGRYLEDFVGWPVDGVLINIFDRAFSKTKVLTKSVVMRWVVENNVRFPAKKGDMVRAKIGNMEVTGKVMDVIRETACAVIGIRSSKSKTLIVNAEEVMSVVPLIEMDK